MPGDQRLTMRTMIMFGLIAKTDYEDNDNVQHDRSEKLMGSVTRDRGCYTNCNSKDIG